jgi:hypothetical protein
MWHSCHESTVYGTHRLSPPSKSHHCPQAAPDTKASGEAAGANSNGAAAAVPSSTGPKAEMSNGAAAEAAPAESKAAPTADEPTSNGIAEVDTSSVAAGTEGGNASPSRKKARRDVARDSEAQPMELDAAKAAGKDVL